MQFIEEINLELENINLEELRNFLWEKHLSNLFIDKDNKEELTEIEIGFFSLFFKNYDSLIIPLIHEKIIPEFEDWYESPIEFEEVKLQSFVITNLKNGEWEVFFEDTEEDLLVGLVMIGWDLNYTTKIG